MIEKNWVKDFMLSLLGRLIFLPKIIFLFISDLKKSIKPFNNENHFNRTGILVKDAGRIEFTQFYEIILPHYDNLAHSYWRAQELSLFLKNLNIFQRPILDFGCGDGTFASFLFKKIDYGIDIDNEALAIASKYNIYKELLSINNSLIPIKSGTISSVISNSVLEHCTDLDKILAEISRVLKKNGHFIFTVPTATFKAHMKKYFGNKICTYVNQKWFHRNLYDENKWENLLNEHNFSIISLKHYQPDWFTLYYWIYRFLEKSFSFYLPFKHILWNRSKKRIIDQVRNSIEHTDVGGNIFVIALKDS